MAQDRVQSDVLNFTQEFLGMMLGSRRTTVTLIAGALQRAELIEYCAERSKSWIAKGLRQPLATVIASPGIFSPTSMRSPLPAPAQTGLLKRSVPQSAPYRLSDPDCILRHRLCYRTAQTCPMLTCGHALGGFHNKACSTFRWLIATASFCSLAPFGIA